MEKTQTIGETPMTTPASTTAGARDGTAAPLIEVSALALRVDNRRVAAAPMS
jgi:hypothetical protein